MSKDYNIQKLKGSENYHNWSFAISNILELKQLKGCISEPVTEVKPEKLTQCKAILSLNVEESLYVHIRTCTTAKNIWTTLQNLFEDKGLSRKISLLRGLITSRLEECGSMQNYIDTIMDYKNKLNGIDFIMSDEWTTAILLAGLNDAYKPFIMSIEASEKVITVDKIVTKLLDSAKEESSGEAFFGKKKSFRNPKSKRRCYNCNSTDHLSNTCDKPNKRHNKYNENGNAKNAFSAFLCEENKTDWYIDSGASNHMTPNRNFLTNIKQMDTKNIVSANNCKMPVKCVGNMQLNLNNNVVDINNVLYVPDLIANLLSVNKIVEKGNTVIF